MERCFGVRAGFDGLSWCDQLSQDGCGQAENKEVKLVPHNSQEMFQKHESVQTYLERRTHTVVTKQKQIDVDIQKTKKTRYRFVPITSAMFCDVH